MDIVFKRKLPDSCNSEIYFGPANPFKCCRRVYLQNPDVKLCFVYSIFPTIMMLESSNET